MNEGTPTQTEQLQENVAVTVSGLRAMLTHCILNRRSHSVYWKSPNSILGTSGYEIYIFREKND